MKIEPGASYMQSIFSTTELNPFYEVFLWENLENDKHETLILRWPIVFIECQKEVNGVSFCTARAASVAGAESTLQFSSSAMRRRRKQFDFMWAEPQSPDTKTD